MKIKICGVTNVADAEFIDNLGADFIGLIFAEKSPRRVDVVTAKKIIARLKHAQPIGVFVEQSSEEIQKIVDELGLFAVQLYFEPTQKIRGAVYIRAMQVKDSDIIKASSVILSEAKDLIPKGTYKKICENGNKILRFAQNDKIDVQNNHPNFYLLDTYKEHAHGGTGKKFDWSILDFPLDNIFIAGGITPENIAEVKKLQPFAADICSGVEKNPGIKDHAKLEKLFKELQKC